MKINGWKTARKSKWVQRRSRSVFPIRVSRKTYCQEQTPMRLKKFKKNIQKHLKLKLKGFKNPRVPYFLQVQAEPNK